MTDSRNIPINDYLTLGDGPPDDEQDFAVEEMSSPIARRRGRLPARTTPRGSRGAWVKKTVD